MIKIDVKQAVTDALQIQWPQFETTHPRLAAFLDQELLIENAVTDLNADPDYQQAMQQADAAGLGAEQLASVVNSFVKGWLGRLF